MMNADRAPTQANAPDDLQVKPWLRISEVFHPFHPDEDHEVAFAHALKMALAARARLSLMCLQPAGESKGAPLVGEPSATLARWSRVQGGRPEDIPEISVRHLQVTSQNPVKACVRYLQQTPTDLIVLAAHLQQGKMTWLGRSTAQTLAAKVGQMTLFVPQGVKGFVAWADGAVTLQSILVAVTREPRPEPAIEAARRLMVSIPRASGAVTLLHVGGSADIPDLRLPNIPGWTWNTLCEEGDVVETILRTATETRAGLIVMTTAGSHGFLDVLRGTVSEHVLREARCPLLAMPVGSFLG
jgi:hypothetical protein